MLQIRLSLSRHFRFSCSKSLSSFAELPEEDRFKFDLEGFLVVKNVFTKEEICAANEAVDKHESEMKERLGALRNTKEGTTLAGDGQTGRMDMAGMLSWPSPDRDIFRRVLTHPKLIPYYHSFLGEGYRLDHLPLLVSQRPGAEGFHLHGGPLSEDGKANFNLTYHVLNNEIRTSLIGVAVQLTDVDKGQGGFCVLKGSHKSNFKVPKSIIHGDKEYLDLLHQPESKAGDVLFFSEATTHGSLAWDKEAKHNRRTAIFRFSPHNFAYSRSYFPSWSDEMYEGLTEAEKAVLQPPYNMRLDRPYLTGISSNHIDVGIQSRAEEKKQFDQEVFKNEFF